MSVANVTIVIIEDHAIVRGLLARVAQDAFPRSKVTLARDGRQGVELCRQEKPELVLLDLDLPDGDGIERVQEIRAVAPAAKILVLSSHTEPYILHRVQQVRVDGFVDKNEGELELLAQALQQVIAGQMYFSPSVQEALTRFRSNPNAFSKLLSEREQALLRLLGRGWTDGRIAEEVGLKEITVRNHRRNIMGRLGIHSTPELIRYALENGFSRVRGRT